MPLAFGCSKTIGKRTTQTAAKSTMFFTIYCPSIVGAKGKILKHSSGNKKMGAKVIIKWPINTGNTHLSLSLNKRHNPMQVSRMAKANKAWCPSSLCPDIAITVCSAITSAGLRSGKNFKNPKCK